MNQTGFSGLEFMFFVSMIIIVLYFCFSIETISEGRIVKSIKDFKTNWSMLEKKYEN